MDIRNFFLKRKLDDTLSTVSNEVNIESKIVKVDINVDDKNVIYYKNDIGNYLIIENIDDALKLDILCNPWVPSILYNFKNDLKSDTKRSFRHVWLEENNSWLSYSAIEGIKIE